MTIILNRKIPTKIFSIIALVTHTVVSGKAVNYVHVVPQRLSVLLGYKHRSDLSPAGADPRQILRREEQMMRRRLARHRPALLLRGADHRNLIETNETVNHIILSQYSDTGIFQQS